MYLSRLKRGGRGGSEHFERSSARETSLRTLWLAPAATVPLGRLRLHERAAIERASSAALHDEHELSALRIERTGERDDARIFRELSCKHAKRRHVVVR